VRNDYAYAIAFLLALTACTESKEPPKEPVKDAAVQTGPMAMKHLKLLHPEPVIEKRVSSDELATFLKGASAAIIAHDAAHPNELPADLDLVVVVRPDAVRFWLVGAMGDISSPALDAAFAKLAKPNVREGNVAAVQSFARVGTYVAPRDPFLPAGWKYAADTHGSDIDRVIDTVWPRP
jgi:hypothetical protein